MKTTATTGFEIEVEISGTYVPGYPATGPSYASGGDPAEPDGFEDLQIEDLFGLRRSASTKSWDRTSLLRGIDRKAPGVREALDQLFDNIIEFLGQEDIEIALGAEVGDA